MNMISTVEHPTLGAVRLLRGPIRFDGRATPESRAAPLLGEHTREILEELGLDAASVDGLIENGLAALLQEYEAKIAALERMVGRQVPEIGSQIRRDTYRDAVSFQQPVGTARWGCRLALPRRAEGKCFPGCAAKLTAADPRQGNVMFAAFGRSRW
jgi:hypothetical protein